jgi:hypothetical protein
VGILPPPLTLSEQLTEHGLDLAHERILYDGEEQIVLTASTPDLQAFCLAYAQDPDAFVESGRPAHRLSGGDAVPTTD